MEKMTKPANMLVKELMQQTMTESLYGRDKAQGSHCHADITSLSTRHTLSRGMLGGGEGLLDSHFASGGIARRRNTFILTPLSLKWQRASAASQHLERISSHFPRWHRRGRALFLRVLQSHYFEPVGLDECSTCHICNKQCPPQSPAAERANLGGKTSGNAEKEEQNHDQIFLFPGQH